MKKKTTKRATTRKSTRRTTRSSEHLLLLPFSFRRIILVTSAIALFLGVVVIFNKSDVNKAVAGMSITRGLFAQATISLPDVPNAVSYTVYYKKTSESDFTNTAWGIPANTDSYTISYLKKGDAYRYKIAAVDANGAEFSWTNEEDLIHIVPME